MERTIWGLLPERRIYYQGPKELKQNTNHGLIPSLDDKSIEEFRLIFSVTEQLRLIRLPADIWKIVTEKESRNPLRTDFINQNILSSSWCIACDYEIPEERDIKVKYAKAIKNRMQAQDLMFDFSFLAALKYRLNLFPGLIFETASDGSEPYLIETRDTPHSFPYKPFWKAGVESSQLEELRRLLQRYVDKQKKENEMPHRFSVATLMLYKAFIEKMMEISIVFLTTCLEKLFLEGADRELGHTLAVRIACFLNSDLRERKDLYRKIKDAYGSRSRVIHGNLSALSHKELVKLGKHAEILVKYACEVILKFLQLEEDDDSLWGRLKLAPREYREFLRNLDFGII